MAQITLNIPDDKIDRIVNAIASDRNMYYEQVNNPDYNPDDPNSTKTIPNQVTKAAFAKDFIVRLIKNVVIESERDNFNTQLTKIGEEVKAIDIH